MVWLDYKRTGGRIKYFTFYVLLNERWNMKYLFVLGLSLALMVLGKYAYKIKYQVHYFIQDGLTIKITWRFSNSDIKGVFHMSLVN